jgi:hypothetical protein
MQREETHRSQIGKKRYDDEGEGVEKAYSNEPNEANQPLSRKLYLRCVHIFPDLSFSQHKTSILAKRHSQYL